MITKNKIEQKLKEVENKFQELSEKDPYEEFWCSPHYLACELVKKQVDDTINFIEKFTPRGERGMKFQKLLNSLTDLSYYQKIEDQKILEALEELTS